MRKISITALLSILATLLFAQDLISKIPAKANVVASINAGKLIQLMPAEEWNNSAFGKKLLEMSSKKTDNPLTSINDIGINLSGTIYYFHTENDSLHYNYMLVPLSDGAKLDAFFTDKPFSRLENNIRLAADNDSSGFMMWNNNQLLYVNGILKSQYFNDPVIAERHGLYYPRYYSDTAVAAIDSVAAPVATEEYPVVDSAVISSQDVIMEEIKPEPAKPKSKSKKAKLTKKHTPTTKKGSKTKKVKAVEPPPETEPLAVGPTDADKVPEFENTTNDPNSYDYNNDYQLRKTLTAQCTEATIKSLFANNPDTSIATNPQYVKTKDANAVASIWVDRPMDLYSSLIPANFLYRGGMPNNFLNRVNNSGYKSFTAKFYLEEKQIRLSTAVELTEEMSGIQQQIFNRKLNKKFFKYINSDSLLGYMTWVMDTKSYLNNFPRMLENAYGRMGLGLSGDEYSLLGELFSFLLDEDAITRLVKGDGMVLFNGLYQQQTTYTDYVYDDNYKATPVEKSKTDTLPRFILLFSSDENDFEKKLVNYGIKKDVVKQRNGFFELSIPRSPVSLFFLNKDGIFFLSNSLNDIQNISNNTFSATISKQERKFLQSHNYTMYINPSKIAGELASTQIGAAESLSSAMNSLRSMGNVRAMMHPIQANVMSGELTMDVPPNNRNALKYIFDIFDSFIK